MGSGTDQKKQNFFLEVERKKWISIKKKRGKETRTSKKINIFSSEDVSEKQKRETSTSSWEGVLRPGRKIKNGGGGQSIAFWARSFKKFQILS